MATKTSSVPDAWDDDWEAQADKEEGGVKLNAPEVKLSKAERLAQHAEENKKMWQSAEAPEPFHFLAAKDAVPLKSEFKPTLKVLSRKPVSQDLEDGDDNEQPGKNQLTVEEMRAKTQREREEKQKKYEEVRARLFGTEPKSGSSSPGNATPPNHGEDGRNGGRGKGRNRGNGGGSGRAQDLRRPDSGQSGPSGPRELYDPNYTAKPGSISIARRGNDGSISGRSTPNPTRVDRDDAYVLRTPRGPDAAGRGGFGFTNRGGKSG